MTNGRQQDDRVAIAREHRLHGRYDECSKLLLELLQHDPMNAHAMLEGALLAIATGDYPVAERFLQACRLFDPTNADLLVHAATSAFHQRQPDRAVQHLTEAAALAPGDLAVRIARAQLLFTAGRDEEGLREMQVAAQLPTPPGSVEGTRRALARVAVGDWDGGWAEFAMHWEHTFAPHFRAPRWWRGEALAGEDLHVVAYGGLGDTIFYARFLALAANRVRALHLCVPAPLQRLLRDVPGVASLTPHVSEIPEGAVTCSLWHLAWLLRDGYGESRPTAPYLHAPDDGPRLPPTDGLRVGIAWAGNARAGHDADRSPADLAALSPLLGVAGVQWYGLHPEARAKAECAALGVTPLPEVRDLADTAAVLRQLDLVITVDSAVSNLAPALGVPTWVFCTRIPELRWPVGHERSPWFPSVRPFRRRDLNDWDAVARAAAAALAERVQRGVDADLPDYRRR